jgi:hypothetical protein
LLSFGNSYYGLTRADYSGLDFTWGNRTRSGARIAPQFSGIGSYLRFGTSNDYDVGITNTALTIDPIGNVGIGTTAPGSALEVAGQVKITGGAPGAGKVLTSDAAGLASWAAAPGGSVSALSAATASQTLANADFSQTWNWDAVTAGSGLNLGSSSVTSGILFNAASTSTAMTGTVGNFILSGDNAANTGSVLKATVAGVSSAAVPLMITNGGTGMSFRVNDNGSDSDASPFVIDNAGNVGIGTTAPSYSLDVVGPAQFVGNNHAIFLKDGSLTTQGFIDANSGVGFVSGSNAYVVSVRR